MGKKYSEYKGLDLSKINKDTLAQWKDEGTFEQSLKSREGCPSFIFFEGPPSANGMPGIHHVMARTIKDVFCRYKTMRGFRVDRKAGWDTHGLPVELGVEKKLGITKEDIGRSISIEEYNRNCKAEVMRYTSAWQELTDIIGYWVDMQDPYITYDSRYVETLWSLLKTIYGKGLLYKGKTIQPYSPAAGTGLSTHELNQPGCYRDVKDTTAVAQFAVERDAASEKLFVDDSIPVYILAWTTTPWTLPSNTALAVGAGIHYLLVDTFNPYTGQRQKVVLAKDRLSAYFNAKDEDGDFDAYSVGSKSLPYRILSEYKGSDLVGIRYRQLIPWVRPEGDAFRVIPGDYVTTVDGTGIVHIAPTFGADDDRVAKQAGIAPLILRDKARAAEPMVDRQGRFYPLEALDPDFVAAHVDTQAYGEYAGRYVKNPYDPQWDGKTEANLDIDLSVMLKRENKAFRVEKHVHNYPHCWRTDKPILYYPLDSWFIKVTAVKERMIELNNTINWKPASTGEGRFGKWLENLVDWNLSRSRFWGTPLPIWATDDKSELKCIGSAAELIAEIEKAIAAGVMTDNPYKDFVVGDYSSENYQRIDLHRPYVDNVVLVSADGRPMRREPDLIDVWFDSGAMPFAQWHYPFERKEKFAELFPADFIAEGVDQTRGWFYTLHAIATMIMDDVAYKNIISNGLVLDKAGNKMSKRLGNAVDPFTVVEKYGADAVRWYMITNAQPWDNLKFDIEGVADVNRKFFGTLYNTYSFFALYANVDGFDHSMEAPEPSQRPEIDRWILSELNTLVSETGKMYDTYEPTRAGRLIATFVDEHLSNWYVRLNRKRFWRGGLTDDKKAAYQTLYTCLKTVAQLAAPIAPFFADRLYRDLVGESQSVHLSMMPDVDTALIDSGLERRMKMAQRMSSMILGLRRKVNIRVRQPLSKVMVPIVDSTMKEDIQQVESVILSEVNIKSIEYLTDSEGVFVKRVKANFKTLGPRYGKQMKSLAEGIAQMPQAQISQLEREGALSLEIGGERFDITLADVEITTQDIPGWLVATEGPLTIALDIQVTPELRSEGVAREIVNRVQNLRKESGLDVTDRIEVTLRSGEWIDRAVADHREYIQNQVLAQDIVLVDIAGPDARECEIDEGVDTAIAVRRV